MKEIKNTPEIWAEIDRVTKEIMLPDDVRRIDALGKKLGEYEARVVEPDDSAFYATIILQELLRRGKIHDLFADNLSSRRQGTFNPTEYLKGLKVIASYAKYGYAGDKILPGLEGRVRLPKDDEAKRSSPSKDLAAKLNWLFGGKEK